jgi:hypothetical protein
MKENNSILHTKKIQNHKNHRSTRVNEISYCQMDAEKWKEGAIRGREEKKNQKHQNPNKMHKSRAKLPRQMTRKPKTQ